MHRLRRLVGRADKPAAPDGGLGASTSTPEIWRAAASPRPSPRVPLAPGSARAPEYPHAPPSPNPALEEAPATNEGSEGSSDEEALPPPQVGRYRVVGVLGRGGECVVYDAVDGERRAAVKLCRRSPSGGRSAAEAARVFERLEREARALLHDLPPHPNVVRAFEAYSEPEYVALALERADRGDLLVALRQGRISKPHEMSRALLQIGRALLHVHARGVVHGDVKLENVLLFSEEDGGVRCVLADWGFTRRPRPGVPNDLDDCGSWHYCAPEQFIYGYSGMGPEIDVWAFGVVAYAVHAKRLPFLGESARLVAAAVKTGRYDASAVRDLDARGVVVRALETDRERRPAISELLDLPYFADAEAAERAAIK